MNDQVAFLPTDLAELLSELCREIKLSCDSLNNEIDQHVDYLPEAQKQKVLTTNLEWLTLIQHLNLLNQRAREILDEYTEVPDPNFIDLASILDELEPPT